MTNLLQGQFNGMRAVFLREFHGYFATPLAYVFIVIFLFTTGAFAFYIGNFFDAGRATLAFSSPSTLGSICSSCLRSPCACGPKSKKPGHWKS